MTVIGVFVSASCAAHREREDASDAWILLQQLLALTNPQQSAQAHEN